MVLTQSRYTQYCKTLIISIGSGNYLDFAVFYSYISNFSTFHLRLSPTATYDFSRRRIRRFSK